MVELSDILISMEEQPQTPLAPQTSNPKRINWKIILGIFLLVIVVVIIFFLINKKSLLSIPISRNIVGTKTAISCASDVTPIIEEGEKVTKKVKQDFDNDGSEELLVVYEKMVPGWEGMPMPQNRLAIFTCRDNFLVASFEASPFFDDTIGMINYSSRQALLLTRYGGGWDLLVKKGDDFQKISPDAQRDIELEKLGVVSMSGYGIPVSVLDNVIRESVPVTPTGDESLLCAEGDAYAKISYKFEDQKFYTLTSSLEKQLEKLGNVFKYPSNWSCANFDGSDIRTKPVADYRNAYKLYPTSSRNVVDAISISLPEKDVSCESWMKNTSYKHKACLMLDEDRSYADDIDHLIVYTNSTSPAVVEGFNLFVKTNEDFTKRQ